MERNDRAGQLKKKKRGGYDGAKRISSGGQSKATEDTCNGRKLMTIKENVRDSRWNYFFIFSTVGGKTLTYRKGGGGVECFGHLIGEQLKFQLNLFKNHQMNRKKKKRVIQDTDKEFRKRRNLKDFTIFFGGGGRVVK